MNALCIVMTVFVLSWLVMYPEEFWEALIFKDRSWQAILVGIGIWIFIAGSSIFVVTLFE